MRVEDLDAARTRPAAVAGNLAELRWLGLDWDEGPDVGGVNGPYLQSERGQGYAAALERLTADGHLAESFLTRREVAELAGDAPSKSVGEAEAGLGAAYGLAHRRLNSQLTPSRRAAGRRPSLRFIAPPGVVAFDDAIAGPQAFDAMRDVGDFVVRRADGLVAYQLAVVVDDHAMGVTEVARGADLLSSSAAQLLLYDALGLPAPRFAHVGLLLDAHGAKLSKRHGAASLHELRRAGVGAPRVLGLLARTLGWLPELRELSVDEALAMPAGSDGSASVVDPRAMTPGLDRPYRLSTAELAWLGLSPPTGP